MLEQACQHAYALSSACLGLLLCFHRKNFALPLGRTVATPMGVLVLHCLCRWCSRHKQPKAPRYCTSLGPSPANYTKSASLQDCPSPAWNSFLLAGYHSTVVNGYVASSLHWPKSPASSPHLPWCPCWHGESNACPCAGPCFGHSVCVPGTCANPRVSQDCSGLLRVQNADKIQGGLIRWKQQKGKGRRWKQLLMSFRNVTGQKKMVIK